MSIKKQQINNTASATPNITGYSTYLISAILILVTVVFNLSCFITLPCLAKKSGDINSPFSLQFQKELKQAKNYMRSGKYDKAKSLILSILSTSTNVSQCLVLADSTDKFAYPMMEARRECLKKARMLCQKEGDFLLVALKARQYQCYEITKDCIQTLIQNAHTMSELIELARKAQDVALNDVAHLAMEKAYDGIKTRQDGFAYADQCKSLGMEDLVRKTIKQVIDDESSASALCDIAARIEKYNMREEIRYCLRKALDHCETVPDMNLIKEVAVRLNEPDVKDRADYFVRKGLLLQKIRQEQETYQNETRQWQQGQDIEAARQRDAQRESQAKETAGFGSSNSGSSKSTSSESTHASSGY